MKSTLPSDTDPEQHFLNYHVQLSGSNNQPLDIPVGGAIGLLALGDIGTIAWRQKILQVKNELASRTQAHLAEGQAADSLTSKIAGNDKT